MTDKSHNQPRKRPQPLNHSRLQELALAYVARFATTQAKLRLYLQRKLRERGWNDEGEPQIETLITRYSELGYVDDAAWARMKAGSLLRRGYGARRVSEVLGHAGVAEDLKAQERPKHAEQRQAALVLARRRRFGPFSRGEEGAGLDPRVRDKQVAAMLRAGHSLDIVRRIVESSDIGMLEEWVESEFGDE